MAIVAVGKFIMIEKIIAPDRSEGGILIPDAVKNKTVRGRVMSVGEDYEGQLKQGDVVYWPSHVIGHNIRVDDKEVLFCQPDEIYGREVDMEPDPFLETESKP